MGSKHLARTSFLLLVGLALLAGLTFFDLGQKRPAVQAASCWQAEITEQWTDTDLAGSVLRVAVQGKGGLPVYVRSMGGFEAVNFTGTKPEYGPNVAEFAPLSKGDYLIEPQGLGLVFPVFVDGKGYVRVDFWSSGCPTPTATATTTPAATRRPASATPPPPRATATPTRAATQPPASPAAPAGGWQGRVVEHQKALAGRVYGTIVVRVIGRPAGQQVEIRSGSWSATCTTGTKPEHGPDACEFGALNGGTYRLSPKDLGTHLDVTLALQDFVRVEFYDTTLPPVVRWTGRVVENTNGSQPTEFVNSAIAVAVTGKPWHQVEIRSGSWSTTCTTGTKPEYGDACEFSGLRAATYTITPKDLGASVQVTADGWGWALVRFEAVSAPAAPPPSPTPTAAPTRTRTPAPAPTATATASKAPPPAPSATATPGTKTGWQGWIVSNSSGQGGQGAWSVIIVRVLNYGGVPVRIDGGGSWSDTCVTGAKPELGADACSFGGLAGGTYTVRPEGSDLALQVTMDGLGTAELHFAKP